MRDSISETLYGPWIFSHIKNWLISDCQQIAQINCKLIFSSYATANIFLRFTIYSVIRRHRKRESERGDDDDETIIFFFFLRSSHKSHETSTHLRAALKLSGQYPQLPTLFRSFAVAIYFQKTILPLCRNTFETIAIVRGKKTKLIYTVPQQHEHDSNGFCLAAVWTTN